MPKPRILVVDDEVAACEMLAGFLANKMDCFSEMALSGEEALLKLKESKFDLVVIDIKMPGKSGIDVMKEAAKFTPETKFLAFSAYDSDEIVSSALKAGAVDFLYKPLLIDVIKTKVVQILTQLGKYNPDKA